MIWGWRLFTRFRESETFGKLLPYLFHVAMVVGVLCYIVVGAYVIRRIEARRIAGQDGSMPTAGWGRRGGQRAGAGSGFKSGNVSGVPAAQVSQTAVRLKRNLGTGMTRSRLCVIEAMRRIAADGDCQLESIALFRALDDCYEADLRELLKRELWGGGLGSGASTPRPEGVRRHGAKAISGRVSDDNWEYWTMKDSILFCFTIITTIGYGNVAPSSVLGRVFVILYGLVGIPSTMLVIANLGKFLAQLLRQLLKQVSSLVRCLICTRKGGHNAEKAPFVASSTRNGGVYAMVDASKTQSASAAGSEEVDEGSDDEDGMSPHKDALVLFAAFILYIVAGSWIIAAYEPNMDYFKAVYFNFVTLTTIGLGDLVPESESYLLFTLVYCSIGLALTTIAIEISANYLRRLHYYGRQIDKVANVKIWFGAKKLTMKQLVRNLGEQFNLPDAELEELDLEKFVDEAIKVQSGELATLRSGPPRGRPLYATDLKNAFKEGRVLFVDEEDEFVVSPGKPPPCPEADTHSLPS